MEQLVANIFSNLPVGLLLIGNDGKILQANGAACTILGCPLKGFVGNSFGELFIADESNTAFTQVVLDAIQRETPRIKRATVYHHPDGSEKYLSVISSTERGEDDKIQAIVVIIEDLTEINGLHEREKRMLELNSQLAQERAESLTAFASSVAHQIRNPIMSIAGFSRLLRSKVDNSAQESLKAITDETLKLETMVRAVAEYSAISVDEFLNVDLRDVFTDALHRIEEHPAVMGQEILWEDDVLEATLVGNAEHLGKALAETLLNAAEFAGPGAKVTTSARMAEGRVTLTVTDSGPGFSAEGLHLALDPFYTTKPVGAGMGLARAKRVISEHKGTIAVGNTPLHTGQVIIALPVEPL